MTQPPFPGAASGDPVCAFPAHALARSAACVARLGRRRPVRRASGARGDGVRDSPSTRHFRATTRSSSVARSTMANACTSGASLRRSRAAWPRTGSSSTPGDRRLHSRPLRIQQRVHFPQSLHRPRTLRAGGATKAPSFPSSARSRTGCLRRGRARSGFVGYGSGRAEARVTAIRVHRVGRDGDDVQCCRRSASKLRRCQCRFGSVKKAIL